MFEGAGCENRCEKMSLSRLWWLKPEMNEGQVVPIKREGFPTRDPACAIPQEGKELKIVSVAGVRERKAA